jgi:hypothetical protein
VLATKAPAQVVEALSGDMGLALVRVTHGAHLRANRLAAHTTTGVAAGQKLRTRLVAAGPVAQLVAAPGAALVGARPLAGLHTPPGRSRTCVTAAARVAAHNTRVDNPLGRGAYGTTRPAGRAQAAALHLALVTALQRTLRAAIAGRQRKRGPVLAADDHAMVAVGAVADGADVFVAEDGIIAARRRHVVLASGARPHTHLVAHRKLFVAQNSDVVRPRRATAGDRLLTRWHRLVAPQGVSVEARGAVLLHLDVAPYGLGGTRHSVRVSLCARSGLVAFIPLRPAKRVRPMLA